MRFMLRAVFWLGVASLVLPAIGAFSGNDSEKTAAVGATDAASAAFATVSDMRQFCQRQPDACAVGARVGVALGHTAQAGAKMIYTLLNEALTSNGGDRTARDITGAVSQDTLTESDRIPEWRGPVKPKSIQGKRVPDNA
ncbi:MAG: DUF5330 domain-containing protein [Xanthobacteraceae bacterium]